MIDSELTAQAFITTDVDDNQITAFHPGAMQHSHANSVADAGEVAIGIVAPDGREGMIRHAEQFAAGGIPFIFDPGQGLPMFGAAELEQFVSAASWVTVNDYEWQLMQQKTGWTARELTQRVAALIVTRGAAGSTIYTREAEFEIPAPRCARSSTRPAAVMPTAPASCTGCCTASTGRRSDILPRSWGPSRSSPAARRITALRARSSRRGWRRLSRNGTPCVKLPPSTPLGRHLPSGICAT